MDKWDHAASVNATGTRQRASVVYYGDCDSGEIKRESFFMGGLSAAGLLGVIFGTAMVVVRV